jgi:hypothetical protein
MRDITRATTTKSPITSSVIVRATERDATVTAPVIVARALLAPTIRDTSGNTREIIGDLRTRAEPPSARADVLSRAESRVDSRYAEQHDSEGHVLVNLGGDLTPRCKSRARNSVHERA